MMILLLLSLIALVLTKIADIVTTRRGVRDWGFEWERNPLARWAMLRFGFAGGVGFVMVLWVLVVVFCYGPAWFAPSWYQAATAAGGFAIAWTQWDVARFNSSGEHSWFTRRALDFYERRERGAAGWCRWPWARGSTRIRRRRRE
jgi:hypothetical protein